MMKSQNNKYFTIVSVFAVITFLFSALTNLHYDEAYYYMYSKNLDFGFFDHPPMIGLLINWGTSLFGGEFGLRLFTSIMSVSSFALLLYQFKEEKKLLFPAIFILSFPMFSTHIAGIFAIPDTPLAFFTICFFLVYRKFITKPGAANAILLGLIITAMIYSKYHAFLIIGLTVLSNLNLFKNKYFYLSAIISAILFIPHVLWQFENDFPTLKYHLVERSQPLQIRYTFEYLGNQLLILGPFTFYIIIRLLLKRKAQNTFERSLLFNIWGFIGFFFLMSFKGRVEGHWTAIITPLLILLLFHDLKNSRSYLKWFKPLATITVILILIARTYLAFDVFPNIAKSKKDFYKWEETMQTLKDKTGNEAIALKGSYKVASLYNFYNQDNITSVPASWYRYSQYDFWENTDYLAGKDVCFISNYKVKGNTIIAPNKKPYGFIRIKNYQPFSNCKLIIGGFEPVQDSLVKVSMNLNNHSAYDLEINSNSRPRIGVMDGKHHKQRAYLTNLVSDTILPANSSINFEYTFQPYNKKQNEYTLMLTYHSSFRACTANINLDKNK